LIELSLAEIAEAVGGTIFRGAETDLVSGVSIDFPLSFP
jgi:hypothetical protein